MPTPFDDYNRQSAERVARHAARAEAGLPLFHDGPADPDPMRPVCWACGRMAPNQRVLKSQGWVTVPNREGEMTFQELYCPNCGKGEA